MKPGPGPVAACSLPLILAGMLAGLCAAPSAGAPSPAPQPVHRYTAVALSPDASRVASVEGDSPPGGYYPPIRDLVIRRVADGVSTRVELPCGRIPQCWPGSPAWTADASRIAFTLRTPGSHAYSLYTVASDGTQLTKLLDFAGTLAELRYGHDGTLAMLATANAVKEVGATEAGAPVSGDLDAAPPEQRIAVLEGGGLKWRSPENLFVYEYDWRPDASGFVGTAAPGDGDNNWWIAKLYAFTRADGSSRVIYAPVGPQQQIATPRVSRDGRRVAFIGGIMSDFGSTGGDVFSVPLEGGAALNLTPDMPASATAVQWGCDGTLQVHLLAAEKTQIATLGDGTRAMTPRVLWSAAETVGGDDIDDSIACPSNVTADTHESFTKAPEIQVGRVGHGRDLTSANAGQLAPLRAQSLTWKSDGLDVQGWLLLPERSQGKIPMVTTVHGGPAAAFTPTFIGPGLVSTLLANGYAVLRPNPRGSFGHGERFTLANVRDFGYGDLRDILAGIDAAEKAAPIDDAHLGIMGGSYGGFMTMFAVTQTQRFKAAVAAAGISNWLSYYGENGIDGWMIPYFGASAYDDPAIYAKSSAINFIRNVHTPVFAYVGERDVECPAPQTQEFWHAMKAHGATTAVMIYPGEGHGLREPEHIEDAMQRSLAWFDRFLK